VLDNTEAAAAAGAEEATAAGPRVLLVLGRRLLTSFRSSLGREQIQDQEAGWDGLMLLLLFVGLLNAWFMWQQVQVQRQVWGVQQQVLGVQQQVLGVQQQVLVLLQQRGQ
jgi:hypothetical protein